MKAWLLVVCVAACAENNHFPGGTPPGQNGGGMNGGGTDAGAVFDAGPDAGPPAITGTICAISDPRTRGCNAVTGGGLTVTDETSGASAAVGTDGKFTLPADTGSTSTVLGTNTNDKTWVGGVALVSLDGSGGGSAQIFVMTHDDLTTLTDTNAGFPVLAGDGFPIVHVDFDGAPAAEATLSAIDATVQPHYDAGDKVLLSSIPPTGSEGTAMYFNAPPGTYTITISRMGATLTTTVPVRADSITVVNPTF